VTYPSRQVNNIYFETADYSSLQDNLAGVATRRKLRLRWYGPLKDTVCHAQLELKCKEGAVGWKEICPLALDQTAAGLLDLGQQSWVELCQTIRAATDRQADLWLAHFFQPVLINHYQRAYYETVDRHVRLTVDSRLRAYDQRSTNQPNLRCAAPLLDRVVIEFKADRQHYQLLTDVLARFPLRVSRHSKYVRGMLAASDWEIALL
jgi:SPX domain protein involved in polyphosphate accumulation